jgi:hypothetical protein
VTNIVNTVVDRLVPDKAESQRIKDEVAKEVALSAMKGELAQLDVNKAEAASGSMFVAGWRPFIGWVCGSALAFQFVLSPIGQWVADVIGHHIPPPPSLDEMLWQLMFGMLGMGTLRTMEKIKGVASK